jgi:hypothetical protein
VEIVSDASAELGAYLRSKFNFAVNGNMIELANGRHAVTYRDIRLAPFLISVDRLPRIADSRTVSFSQLDELPISNATRKIADAARVRFQ